MVVMLSLTAGLVALSAAGLTQWGPPPVWPDTSRALYGLAAMVLIFNAYVIHQQVQIKRLRCRLAEQIEVAAEQHRRAEEFFKLAMLDPLTGLHNRRFAEQRLAAEISRSERHGHTLTVLMLDLDGFKLLNDRFGHAAGDAALKVFSERLMRAIRGSDLAVRLGGDEFLVLLPECQFGQVEIVLGRLKPLEVDWNGGGFRLGFSAGWADYRAGETLDQLLCRADRALYANKAVDKTNPLPVQ